LQTALKAQLKDEIMREMAMQNQKLLERLEQFKEKDEFDYVYQ